MLEVVRGNVGKLYAALAFALMLAVVTGGHSFAQAPDFTSEITSSVTTLGAQLGVVIGAVVLLGVALIAFRAGWKYLRRMAG
jgi:hypothetical protein